MRSKVALGLREPRIKMGGCSAVRSGKRPHHKPDSRNHDRAGRQHREPDHDRGRRGDRFLCGTLKRTTAAQALPVEDSPPSSREIRTARAYANPGAFDASGKRRPGLREADSARA